VPVVDGILVGRSAVYCLLISRIEMGRLKQAIREAESQAKQVKTAIPVGNPAVAIDEIERASMACQIMLVVVAVVLGLVGLICFSVPTDEIGGANLIQLSGALVSGIQVAFVLVSAFVVQAIEKWAIAMLVK